MNRPTLKKLFANDPEVVAEMDRQEQNDILRKILEETSKKSALEINAEMIKGDKGDNPTNEELIALIEPLIPAPLKGDPGRPGNDGRTPIKNIDYFDGKTPIAGIDFPFPKNGEDGKSYSAKELQAIIQDYLEEQKFSKNFASKNELANLRATMMLNYGGHGGNGVFYYDLSPYLDGVTKVFTIPSNTKILQVTSSSAPVVFRPIVDYTGSGSVTLTFDAAIDASAMLASGQTITLLYS